MDVVVAEAFFDGFPPDTRRRLPPWMGPRSRTLLERLDAGSS